MAFRSFDSTHIAMGVLTAAVDAVDEGRFCCPAAAGQLLAGEKFDRVGAPRVFEVSGLLQALEAGEYVVMPIHRVVQLGPFRTNRPAVAAVVDDSAGQKHVRRTVGRLPSIG